MIHIYCGDGKGKTTAAMGLALRMAGTGKNVLIGQFFKDGSSGEIKALKTIPGVEVLNCGTVPGRYVHMTDIQKEQARKDYTAYLLTLLERGRNADLLVLDEVVSALNRGIVPMEPVTVFLRDFGQKLEIVLTGRNPAPELVELADYVTEMRKEKHPFDKGVRARKGIEF